MLSSRTLGCAPMDIEFHGLAAHAAGCPENGKNALDAQILVYNGLCVLRQQLTPDVRIHSIITDGGTAPNVIPDFTKSKYDTRAAAMDTLHDQYDKMVLTPGLDRLYEKNLNLLGLHSKPQFF
jgi:metal-dependent amidase/aminoacylase/carboxypeptidase family protein